MLFRSGGDFDTLQAAVVAARYRVLHAQSRARISLRNGPVEHHAQRAHIDALARRRVDGQVLHLLGGEEREPQVLGLVVDVGTDGREAYLVLDARQHVEECLAAGKVDVTPYVVDIYFQLVTHNALIKTVRKSHRTNS